MSGWLLCGVPCRRARGGQCRRGILTCAPPLFFGLEEGEGLRGLLSIWVSVHSQSERCMGAAPASVGS